jgi:hypothetical protein
MLSYDRGIRQGVRANLKGVMHEREVGQKIKDVDFDMANALLMSPSSAMTTMGKDKQIEDIHQSGPKDPTAWLMMECRRHAPIVQVLGNEETPEEVNVGVL